ncbi:MAG: hypothetical protein IKS44_04455 [Bacteroidales bacterium]|nr:hypothetical protein [Bacteroidales bacterium]
MTKLVFSNIFRFLILIIIQILIINFVYLGGYMVPFIYLLAVLMLPTRMGKIPTLLVAFAAGLLVDLFCNIPGFHTFSCTLVAFARLVFGNRMITRDDPIDIDVPGIHTVPFQQLAMYLLVMSFIYSVTYFLLEAFSFGNIGWMLLSMLLSTLATWVLMLLCQLLLPNNHKN